MKVESVSRAPGGAGPPRLFAPYATRRGARGVRFLLALVLFAGLACSFLSPVGLGPRGTPTPVPAYLGQFDCYGAESGLGAYAGRITIQPGGAVTFRDYDMVVQTGAWTYEAATNTFAFTGSTGLASAIYQPASDTLTATFVPVATVVHAEGGTMSCMRAKPGITGPP